MFTYLPPPYPLPPFSSSLWFLWTLSTMFTCRHHWSCSGSWCRSAMEARGPAPGARMARMIVWFPPVLRTTCNQSSVGIHGYSPAALWSFRGARSHFQYYSSELLSLDAGVGVGGCGGWRGGQTTQSIFYGLDYFTGRVCLAATVCIFIFFIF